MTRAGSPAPGVSSVAVAPRSPAGELRTRLLTALVLIPTFLVAVALGHEFFLGAAMALAGVGAWEFLTMAARKPNPVRRLPGVALAVALPAAFYWGWGSPSVLVTLLTVAVTGVALAQLFAAGARESIGGVSVTVFAAAYVGLLFGHFVLVREIAREMPGAAYWVGGALLAIPLGLTWINDTAAYVIGKRWGRRRLAPGVSPGKSLEGALGALVVTIAVAVPLLWLVDRWVPVFTAVDGFALGLLVGVAAPCGDLVESAFKRDAGVKDVSQLVPGHGGVLDRFDSLLFTVPAFYYYVRQIVL